MAAWRKRWGAGVAAEKVGVNVLEGDFLGKRFSSLTWEGEGRERRVEEVEEAEDVKAVREGLGSRPRVLSLSGNSVEEVSASAQTRVNKRGEAATRAVGRRQLVQCEQRGEAVCAGCLSSREKSCSL